MGKHLLIKWLEGITAFIEQLHHHEWPTGDQLLLSDRPQITNASGWRRGIPTNAMIKDNSFYHLVADIQAVDV